MFKPKRKNLDQPTTVGDFQELAEGIAEIVVTKDEFRDYTKKAFKTFATKDDLQELKRDLPTKNEMQEIKNEIITSNEKIAGEIKTMREEQKVHSINHSDTNKDVKDLKHRMEQVESHAGIN